MKKHTLITAAAALAAAVFACEALVAADLPKPTDGSSFAERKRKRLGRPTGGILEKKIETNFIVFRNVQSEFSVQELNAAVDEIRKSFEYPILLVGASDRPERLAVEITLKDVLEMPDASVLVAPEQGRAHVSAKWLVSDSPTAQVRAHRLFLSMYRAMLMSVGCGVSSCQPSFMRHVCKVGDLDAVKVSVIDPVTSNCLVDAMRDRGVKRRVIAGYRTACMQGWAPAPTNDVQRAIWDELHTPPKKPIVIVPESERKAK